MFYLLTGKSCLISVIKRSFGLFFDIKEYFVPAKPQFAGLLARQKKRVLQLLLLQLVALNYFFAKELF